ncbi:hypothetical protein [Glycomyces sp. YM15]|nr:hypothetical protein [Glycomyces sp. YM15]
MNAKQTWTRPEIIAVPRGSRARLNWRRRRRRHAVPPTPIR